MCRSRIAYIAVYTNLGTQSIFKYLELPIQYKSKNI